MSTTKLFFVLCFLLSLPLLAKAQADAASKVLVKGTVLDSLTTETIPYATIRIYKQTDPQKVEKVVPADANGKFQFSLNQPGEYTMTIEFVGKEPVSKPIVLNNEKVKDFGDILMKDNSKILSEVVVSAAKPLVKVDLDKITYSIEDDPESKTNNVLDMLKKVPMVTVDGEDQIQLKGSSSFKIYINGKPSSMVASNPKDVLRSMPANTIKDIEVITDPGAKYDAEGLAGIINIITQKNTSMGGYTATISSWGNSFGGFGGSGYLTMKTGKFGFTGNYSVSRFRNPESDSYMRRENFASEENKYLFQNGTNKNRGFGQYGNGELSYEIDSLNLINIGFGRYAGNGKQTSFSNNRMENASFAPVTEYNQYTDGTFNYGSTELKADYQKTSKTVKDRLLTVSYRLALSPDDWGSENRIEGILNFNSFNNRQYSDGNQKEHTMQIDYTTPFKKIHTLEAGVKYIIRTNESTSGRFIEQAGNWVEIPSNKDQFKHRQDIYSAYASYGIKYKKLGAKAGLRYEGTNLDVKYPLAQGEQDNNRNYENDMYTLVPSVTVSYQIKQSQTLRLGYNMRIWRPNIWQLNPFENRTDSLNVQVGNPDLKAVKSHTINLNYNFFNPKFNMNASLTYSFVNNDIERITKLDDVISKTTYANIGKNKRLALHTSLNWTPNQKIRVSGNLSGSYVDIKSNSLDVQLSNSGFMGNAYTNIQYTLPKTYRVSAFGSISSPYLQIQGRGSSFKFYGLSLSKGFMSDKLNVNVSAYNVFAGKTKFKRIVDNPTFYSESVNTFSRTQFSLRVSYRFGEMKAQIKKTVRGIINDDSMGGSGGGQSQGGGGQ